MGDYLKDMFIEVRETTQKKDDDILDLVYSTIMESATKPLVTEMAADKAKEFVLSLPKFTPQRRGVNLIQLRDNKLLSCSMRLVVDALLKVSSSFFKGLLQKIPRLDHRDE